MPEGGTVFSKVESGLRGEHDKAWMHLTYTAACDATEDGPPALLFEVTPCRSVRTVHIATISVNDLLLTDAYCVAGTHCRFKFLCAPTPFGFQLISCTTPDRCFGFKVIGLPASPFELDWMPSPVAGVAASVADPPSDPPPRQTKALGSLPNPTLLHFQQ